MDEIEIALLGMVGVMPPKPSADDDYGFQLSPLHLRTLHERFDALAAALRSAQALGAEVADARDGWHMANGTAELAMRHRGAAEARAERLAEALRDLLNVSDKFTGDPDEDAATWVAANDTARAALEQESNDA